MHFSIFWNGFWSKEIILETGLKNGPTWAFGFMLFSAGLTAFYTLRMAWLVFFGAERDSSLHVHSAASSNMKIATATLAAGSFLTWLVAGPLSALLARTLPFHALEPFTTLQMAEEVLFSPGTWIALCVIAAGAGSWYYFKSHPVGSQPWFESLVSSSFGFDWLNQQIVRITTQTGTLLQRTQTGELNWNVLGIIAALFIVLFILASSRGY